MKPTDTLVRAARELLRWDQRKLAEKAGIGIATLRRFETGARVEDTTISAIEKALQKAGVAFLGPEAPSTDLNHGVGLTSTGRPLKRPKPRVYKKRMSRNDEAED